jgi:hypothetical protein
MPKKPIPNFPNVSSIRLPDDFRSAVDLFLKTLNTDTGLYMSRSEFMVVSTYWYLDHLIESDSDCVELLRKDIKKYSRNPRKKPASQDEDEAA